MNIHKKWIQFWRELEADVAQAPPHEKINMGLLYFQRQPEPQPAQDGSTKLKNPLTTRPNS